MGLQYSGDDLNTLKESIINSMEQMNEMSGAVIGKAQTAFKDPSWSGRTASSFSSYFDRVYLPAAAELYLLNSCLNTYINTYYALYVGFVDMDNHAVIYTAETDQLSEDLTGRDTEAETIHTAVETQIDSVKDLTGPISFNDPGITESVQSVLKEIQDMYDRIDVTESRIAADLSEFASACSALSELMHVAVSATVSADGKTIQFDEEALKGALDKVNFYIDNQTQWMADNADQIVAIALIAEADRQNRRAEEAGTVKLIVGILCAVGGVIVTVATGGAAAPVILYGATSTGLLYGVNNAADQYTENGWDGICWLEVGKDVCIGFIVGGVTSGAGYELSELVTTASASIPFVQTGMQSTKGVQMLTYGAVGAGSSVVSGIGSRAAGSIVYQVLENGSIDFGVVLDKSFSGAQIGYDAISGTASGLYTGYRRTHEEQVILDEYKLRDENGNPVKENGRYVANWKKNEDGSINEGYAGDVKYSGALNDGDYIDRVGSNRGTCFTTPGTSVDKLALPYDYNKLFLHRFGIKKTVLDEYGIVGEQPNFGSQGAGGGPQIKIPRDDGESFMSAQDLLDQKIAVEIPIGAVGPYGNSGTGVHVLEVLKDED